MESLDWKYIITTLIAVYAAFTSTKARRDTKLLAEKQLAFQAQSAQHQHFPNLKASIQTSNNRIKVLLTNANNNAALAFRIRFILRIRSDDASIEKEDYIYDGDYIGPHTLTEVDPEPINQLIADTIPFLKRSSSSPHNNFVVRIFLEADPSVGGAEKITLQKAARLKWDGDGLVILPDPNNELA